MDKDRLKKLAGIDLNEDALGDLKKKAIQLKIDVSKFQGELVKTKILISVKEIKTFSELEEELYKMVSLLDKFGN